MVASGRLRAALEVTDPETRRPAMTWSLPGVYVHHPHPRGRATPDSGSERPCCVREQAGVTARRTAPELISEGY